MKKLATLVLISCFVFAGSSLFSQKLKTGDLSVLKGQKTVNLQFDYSKMEVGKFANEEDYIKKGIDDRNKKKEGSGDAWAAKWRADKTEHYQPAFIEAFNKKSDDCGIEVKENATDARYTLIIRTIFLEQGVEAIVGSKPSEIDLVIDVVETTAPDKVIATIDAEKNKGSSTRMTVNGVPVSKESYDTGLRIAEAYETAGKSLAKFVCKQLK